MDTEVGHAFIQSHVSLTAPSCLWLTMSISFDRKTLPISTVVSIHNTKSWQCLERLEI